MWSAPLLASSQACSCQVAWRGLLDSSRQTTLDARPTNWQRIRRLSTGLDPNPRTRADSTMSNDKRPLPWGHDFIKLPL